MKADHGLYSIQVKYGMTILYILWCLNEWNELPQTLEEEIMRAIEAVKNRKDVGVMPDLPILMDFKETASQSSKIEVKDFKFENINVEDNPGVPGKHIQIPVAKRTPTKYMEDREPI